jgi:hypothetical protein
MRVTTWLLVAGALAVGAAWALDPPRPVPPASAEATPASPATPETAEAPPAAAAGSEESPAASGPVTGPEDGAQQGEEETLPPLPAGTKQTGPTPQRFDPSEEVRADFPVSFPVDI